MNLPFIKKSSIIQQSILGFSLVLLVSLICYFFVSIIGYKTVALLLLVSVSIISMLLDIIPVLVSAVLSALIWNFFFIPPTLTFQIKNAEDLLMFLLYFFIAMVNVVLTLKIRKESRKAIDKEEKERTIQLYNTLINSLTHELRTPLVTIFGAIDSLKEGSTNISKSNQIELLNQIDIASLRLNQQVENLLNMSRLESGMLMLRLDWCDINELIQSVIFKQNHAPLQKIIFHSEVNQSFFKLDRGLIEQVIQILVQNSINYTPNNSMIEISVKSNDEQLEILVSDDGYGIPENEMDRIFEKFYRVPFTKPGGCGLGLSIARGFVEAHHGKIRVFNNSKGGASFSIILPFEVEDLGGREK